MFFFRIELSLFDEDKQTLYQIPETRESDEIPVFSEHDLTANPVFKKYVKTHKTGVVDVKYELFKTAAVSEEITDDVFDTMQREGGLELIDGNEFCVINGKERTRSKSKSSTPVFAVIGITFVLIIALSAASQAGKHTGETSVSSDSSDVTSEESSVSTVENLDVSSDPSSDDSNTESMESSEESSEDSSDNSSAESTESTDISDDISDNSEIIESDDGQSFDFPPSEDIQHLQS